MNISKMMWIAVIVCVMSVTVSLSAPAQSLQIGIGGGAYLPTNDAADEFTISPDIHGTLLVGLQNIFKLEGELGYWILQESDDLETSDFSASYYIATGGVRLYPVPTVHLDAGLGAYKASFEWDEFEDSETYGGVYGGAGFELGALDIKARAHAPDFDDFYIGATLTYLFNIQNLMQ